VHWFWSDGGVCCDGDDYGHYHWKFALHCGSTGGRYLADDAADCELPDTCACERREHQYCCHYAFVGRGEHQRNLFGARILALMIRSVAVQRIQDGLGFRTDMADKIILRLQEEQRDLERGKTLPKFLSAYRDLSLLEGEDSIELPTDFLRISGEEISRFNAEENRLVSIPWVATESIDFDYDHIGAPNVAALDLTLRQIYFDNVADTDYTLFLVLFAAGELLDANIENVWLANAPELLIGGAGRRIAADMRNKTAFELFDAMWKQSRASWFNEAILESVDVAGPLVLGANS
jgi:hypothetical protein